MGWVELLLLASLVAPCASGDAYVGSCNVGGAISGDSAVLTGDASEDGTGGSGSGGGGEGSDGTPWREQCRYFGLRCLLDNPRTRVTSVPASSPITLSDIAAFRPAPGVQFMEPDGWAVVGLDTNFYAVRPVEVVDGLLLGQPASVRFTPRAFHWTYGDGGSADLATGGTTWAAQGIREFDPTPTSHVYRTAGEYTIRLVIDFAAEYRFAGGPWIPIPGRIPLRANDLHIAAAGAKTVLVENDCIAEPSGPGC